MPLAWALLQGVLLVLALMSVSWNVVALVLLPLLPAARGQRIGRAAIAGGYAIFWRVAGATGLLQMHADALDPLADEARLIIVANHPSMLDAVMLVSHLPRSACIMKASLMRNPLLGPGARLARYIRNDNGVAMVRAAVQDLRTGGQIVWFPEGTRTTSPPLNPLRPGCTTVARLAQAPIQTVLIETDSPYLGKGWPLWRLPPLPIVFRVRLGRRFAPADDAAALLAEIEAHFRIELHGPVTCAKRESQGLGRKAAH
ncbi:MAG: lysophospholipid acyltransferase family protein [Rubrivivax sp.]